MRKPNDYDYDLVVRSGDRPRRVMVANCEWEHVPPERGPFYCYKKVLFDDDVRTGTAVAKLRVPAGADWLVGIYKNRLNYEYKCRASVVRVVWVREITKAGKLGKHLRDAHTMPFPGRWTLYRVGRLTRPDIFDPNWQNTCSNGIHFFMTLRTAIDYDLW